MSTTRTPLTVLLPVVIVAVFVMMVALPIDASPRWMPCQYPGDEPWCDTITLEPEWADCQVTLNPSHHIDTSKYLVEAWIEGDLLLGSLYAETPEEGVRLCKWILERWNPREMNP